MPPSIVSTALPMLPDTIMARVTGAKRIPPYEMAREIMSRASGGPGGLTLASIPIILALGIIYIVISAATSYPLGETAYANAGFMGLFILHALVSAIPKGGGSDGDMPDPSLGEEGSRSETQLPHILKRYEDLLVKLEKAYEILKGENRHTGRRGHIRRREGLERKIAHLEHEIARVLKTAESQGIELGQLTRTAWESPAEFLESGGDLDYTWSSGDPLFKKLEYNGDTLINRHHRMVPMLVDNLRPLMGHGCRVLEIGTGSGILTRALIESLPKMHGVRFVATDISPQAVKDALTNLSGFENIEVRRGRSFEPIRPNEFFDIIISNPPWYDTKKANRYGGSAMVDKDRKTIREIVTGAAIHLSPGGRLFIIYPREFAGFLASLAEIRHGFEICRYYKTKKGGVGLYELTRTDGSSMRPFSHKIDISKLKERATSGYMQSFSGVRYSAMGVENEIFPEDMVMAFAYGYNYARTILEKGGKNSYKMVIGRDPRPTGKGITVNQIKGMLKAASELGVDLNRSGGGDHSFARKRGEEICGRRRRHDNGKSQSIGTKRMEVYEVGKGPSGYSMARRSFA